MANFERAVSRCTWCVAVTTAFVFSGCHTAVRFSPKQNQDIHVACQKGVDGGRQEPRRSPTVGFLPEKGPHTAVAIYGAEWCDACHVAAEYMKQYGIPYVEMDIEKDAEAKTKCESLLPRAGLGEKIKGLPVIDVRGTIMFGFQPCTLDAAWATP